MNQFYLTLRNAFAAMLCLAATSATAQWQCTVNLAEVEGTDQDVVNITKWKPKTGLSIANNKFGGLIEYLPSGYSTPGNNKKYPVIIYFGGRGAQGKGDSAQLCELFSDQETSLPFQVEKGVVDPKGTYDGTTYEYIIIAPTYRTYQYPSNYPKADEVEGVIDFVEANYRVDPTRIYLTGMSSGANMVINYASNSVPRAKRIAAYNTASLCSSLGKEPNDANAFQNIVDANLHGRFFHCSNDGTCKDSISRNWTIAINNAKPGLATYTIPSNSCDYGGHNSWKFNYSPTYLVDGKNLYNYFVQFTANTALPVVISSINAKLNDNKVTIDWTTSSETSSAYFRIERAGSDYMFKEIGSVAASVHSNSEKRYQFIDDDPLPNLNLYRLVQVDKDGRTSHSETLKVLNKNNGRFHLEVAPNPFTTKLKATINLEKRQRVVATLTDLNGRKISSQSLIANEGSTDIIIPSVQLMKGIYLLKVETEQQTQIKKVIRN